MAFAIAPIEDMTNTAAAGRLSRREWGMALGAAIVAVAIRFPSCFKGFWIDEYYTLRSARLSLGQLFAERIAVGHFPLYFLYAKLGLLLGEREWMLRMTSLLALGLTVLFLTGLFGALNLRPYLPTAWVLAIFFPYWVTIGTEYRYMMTIVAAATGASWALVEYCRNPTLRRAVVMTLVSMVFVAIHPINIFAVAGLIAFLVWNLPRRVRQPTSVLRIAAPFAFGLAAVAPLFWMIRNVPSANPSPAWANWPRRLLDVLEVSFGRSYYWSEWLDYVGFSFNRYIMPSAMTLLLAGAWMAAWLEARRRGLTEAWHWIICIFWIPMATSWLFSALWVDVLGAARYWCLISLPVLMLLALAWHAPLRWWGRRALRALMVFVLGMQFIAAAFDRGDLQREGAQWIVDNHGPQDWIVVARATDEVYLEVFRDLGFDDWDHIERIDTYRRPADDIAQELLAKLQQHPRMLLMFYRPRCDVGDVMKAIAAHRPQTRWQLWRLNKVTTVAALAADPTDPWIASLKEARRPWGPSRGDY